MSPVLLHSITLMITPRPQLRHRMANGRVYDPSAGDKKKFLHKFKEKWNSAPMSRVSLLKLTFRFKLLKSHKKKHFPGDLHLQTPDLDNCIKFCGDALNGVAWSDDRFIGRIMAEKVYDEQDSITIEIWD